jgi:hypothetical protein
MSKKFFIANPYALLTDGVVTDVVYMQSYSDLEIKETLSRCSYEEAVPYSEYGEELFVGYVRIGKWIVPPTPHGLWIFNNDIGAWEPPKDWNNSMEGWFALCVSCEEEEHDHLHADSQKDKFIDKIKEEVS